MESLNFVKGYGKVNPSDDHNLHPPPLHRRRVFLIAISLVVFLTLLVASLIAALILHSATDSEDSESESELASTSAESSLRTVCAVTWYPESCFSSISPLNSPPSNSPFRFFNLSLHASALQVSALKDLAAGATADPAVKDCAELFDDAASQLGRSAELIRGEKVLTKMSLSSLQTWISAALTDHDTCTDGLAEMESTALGSFKVRVQKAEEYLSNTLAILNNSDKFGLTSP